MNRATYLIRVEGVNLATVLDDTADISVRRGASAMLREAPFRLTGQFPALQVVTAEASVGVPPKFGGTAGLVEDRVRAEMRQVYQDRERPAFLDPGGWELLADGRDTHWFTHRPTA